MNIAVFASGRGSNLEAILSAIKDGALSAKVVLVVSDNPTAGVLEIAQQHQIPGQHISRVQFADDREFDQAMLLLLEKEKVEIIALAGYLKKVNPAIIERYQDRILNIHPALLPSFGGKGMYGMKVHRAVIDYGSKVSGVTVHLVDPEYDSGSPVIQRCVKVLDTDTPESLAARVLRTEHEVYPQALQLFAERRVSVQGRVVQIKDVSKSLDK